LKRNKGHKVLPPDAYFIPVWGKKTFGQAESGMRQAAHATGRDLARPIAACSFQQ
jgi:hypothetical protein